MPVIGRDIIALYSESLIQDGSPYSSLESACYGINWAHNLYGFRSACASKLVKNVLEAAKRDLAKPVSKKGPVTPAMIFIFVIGMPVLMLVFVIFV